MIFRMAPLHCTRVPPLSEQTLPPTDQPQSQCLPLEPSDEMIIPASHTITAQLSAVVQREYMHILFPAKWPGSTVTAGREGHKIFPMTFKHGVEASATLDMCDQAPTHT